MSQPRSTANARAGDDDDASWPAWVDAWNEERTATCAELLKALGNPTRLRIVALLCRGHRNVSEIAERLSARQAIVSQQLRILRMSGVVSAVREGGFARYSLIHPGIPDLIGCMERCHAQP